MAVKAPLLGLDKKGVVYTRPWVVDLILDLSGYTPDRDLQPLTIVEPSVGNGAFLDAIVDRLLDSCQKHGRELDSTTYSIQSFELNNDAAAGTRALVRGKLESSGVSPDRAFQIANNWVRHADYLLDRDRSALADVVVGNPPYIRLEDISSERAAAYRAKYPTMVGRADLYVAFFEASLRQLKPGGVCGFICADRWMLNQYGSALREFITSQFSVETVIELHQADAFHSEVSAYPAITVIRRGEQQRVLVARAGLNASTLGSQQIRQIITEADKPNGELVVQQGVSASSVSEWFKGSEPWPCFNSERLALLKYLEANFYPLDSRGTGTRAGIGVASGADSIFLTKSTDVVEPDRLLPMALARDTSTGTVKWSGHYLVNPWNGAGLVNLSHYPKLRAYLELNEDALRRRHVGKRNHDQWFRTIDRVEPGLLAKDKLYIADIKERLNPVLDRGETYPHHNLYFIQSVGWDMEVLGGLLLSDVAQFFVECYGVRMRGGYLRFQAQYLRRIRVPRPQDIDSATANALRDAFRRRDDRQATDVALKLYGIDRIPEDDYGS